MLTLVKEGTGRKPIGVGLFASTYSEPAIGRSDRLDRSNDGRGLCANAKELALIGQPPDVNRIRSRAFALIAVTAAMVAAVAVVPRFLDPQKPSEAETSAETRAVGADPLSPSNSPP